MACWPLPSSRRNRKRHKRIANIRFDYSRRNLTPASVRMQSWRTTGGGGGHGGLHVARTGTGPDRGCPQRPVVVGRCRVRNGYGSRPFEDPTSPSIVDAHKTPQPVCERNPEVPAGLGLIIGKLLQKDRELRYATAADLREDLGRLQSSRSFASSTLRFKHPRESSGVGCPSATCLLLSKGSITKVKRSTGDLGFNC